MKMATSLGFTPPSMNWEVSNLPDELANFKQYCNLIFAGPFSKLTDKEKSSYILLWIGKLGVDTYNSWTWEDAGDEVKPTKIWAKFEKHLAPKVNYRLARYQLQDFRQSPEEIIDNFIARCRNQAAKCKFRDTEETEVILIEQLIKGTKHKKVQERLLEKDEALTLDKAIDISRTYEAKMTHLQELHNQSKDPGNTKKENTWYRCNKKDKIFEKMQILWWKPSRS